MDKASKHRAKSKTKPRRMDHIEEVVRRDATDNSIEAKLVASQSDLANALRETMQEQNNNQAAMQRIYKESEQWKKESRERDMDMQRELVLNKKMKEENAERQRKYARIMDAVKEGLLDKDAAKEMISAQGLF